MTILPGFQKALKRTASLLPLMPKTHAMYRGNPAITILRLLLWLMPSLFIPLVALLGGLLSGHLPTPANICLMLFVMGVATAAIGFFEEALRFQQMRIPLRNAKHQWVSSTVFFVLLQIVIAPAICIGSILVLSTFWRRIHT